MIMRTILTYLRRIMGLDEERLGEVTVIAFRWPPSTSAPSHKGMKMAAPDRFFVLEGLHHGEPLHERIDLLLSEHSPAAFPHCVEEEEVATEIEVYWHVGEQWYKREYLSVMTCS